jgi:hypothetical protein
MTDARIPPTGLTADEIHTEFRKIGFSGAALDFPMNASGIAFRRRFNGVPEGQVMPWTWDYAPNAAMRDFNEAQG